MPLAHDPPAFRLSLSSNQFIMKRHHVSYPPFDFLSTHNRIEDFLSFDVSTFERLLREKDYAFWEKKGQERALKLFRSVAARVPAYKDFLITHRIHPHKIKTIKDFSHVPHTNKKNYIDAYPLPLRTWKGDVPSSNLIAVNAGTTGTLRLWPRGGLQEFEACVMHELIYKNFFEINRYKTLLIIGFPIGMYVSGIATLLPSWLISNREAYHLVIAPVGNKKEEILQLLARVRDEKLDYEQIILAGHPFFVKDIIESIEVSHLKTPGIPMKFLFASEGFTEEWRTYVLSKANRSYKPHHAINLYGCTDLLIIGHETPLSIFLKNHAETNVAAGKHLFGERSTANIFQYNPLFRYAESVDGNLFFTAAAGVPLIRFDIGNAGEIVSYRDIRDMLPSTRAGIPIWQLPFIVLKGRNNYVLEFHLAHIDPEYIRQALDHKRYFSKLTGKFTMRKTHDKKLDQTLEINIELKRGIRVNPHLADDIKKSIIVNLRAYDYRYDVLYHSAKKRAEPKIVLFSYQHPTYFTPGIKPRYILP